MTFQNAKIIAVNTLHTEYHKCDAPRGSKEFQMSSTPLRAFHACPSKWVEPIQNEDGSTSWWDLPGSKSTEWGNLFDTLLLTPKHFNALYAVRPNMYSAEGMGCPKCKSVTPAATCGKCKCARVKIKVQKPWDGAATYCKEWKALQGDKTVVSQSDLFKVNQAIKRFMRDERLAAFVNQSEKQVWVTADWYDAATGLVIPCKCLIDLVPRNDSEFRTSIGDVKTTVNGRVKAWERWCHTAGYEVQAAWNLDMFVAASERMAQHFCFLLSENTAPYEPGKRMMSLDLLQSHEDLGDIASGRRQYKRMMADYCQCLATGKWPGYDDHNGSNNADGWTLVTPNPFEEMARMEAPRFTFGEQESEVEETEPHFDAIP